MCPQMAYFRGCILLPSQLLCSNYTASCSTGHLTDMSQFSFLTGHMSKHEKGEPGALCVRRWWAARQRLLKRLHRSSSSSSSFSLLKRLHRSGSTGTNFHHHSSLPRWPQALNFKFPPALLDRRGRTLNLTRTPPHLKPGGQQGGAICLHTEEKQGSVLTCGPRRCHHAADENSRWAICRQRAYLP